MSSNMKLAMYVCSGPSGQNIVSKCIVSTVNCHKCFFGTLRYDVITFSFTKCQSFAAKDLLAYKMSLFMITQRVYPSIHQAIYINLSGITSEIECSLLSSSKVSIRMGQLLLFIFTFFYYFYKTTSGMHYTD